MSATPYTLGATDDEALAIHAAERCSPTPAAAQPDIRYQLDPHHAQVRLALANLSGATRALLHTIHQAGGYTPPAGYEAEFGRVFAALEAATVEGLTALTA